MASIYEIYKRNKVGDRDKVVLDRINYWMSKNIPAVSDGLLKIVPVISGETSDYIASPYNLSVDDIKEMHKSREWRLMAKLAAPQRMSNAYTNPIKLGLLVSYCDTKNLAFLNFLCILIYSSLMVKYFPNGFDKNVMKYTIDNSDGRTDFKRYEGSLLVVVTKKVETFLKLFDRKLKAGLSDKELREALQSISTRMNETVKTISVNYYTKKVETFLKLFDRKLKAGLSDKELREALQSISTRMNETVKTISVNYYENFNDPDIKITIEYSETSDGKNIISALGVMEAIRQAAVDNLAAPSDKILNMIHLGSNNIKDLKYRILFIKGIPECFGLLSNVTSEMLDDWMRRHPNKVTVKLFRTDFIKTMSKARNVGHITQILEAVTDKMLLDVPDERIPEYDRLTIRRYMYNYVMLNIYASSTSIIK